MKPNAAFLGFLCTTTFLLFFFCIILFFAPRVVAEAASNNTSGESGFEWVQNSADAGGDPGSGEFGFVGGTPRPSGWSAIDEIHFQRASTGWRPSQTVAQLSSNGFRACTNVDDGLGLGRPSILPSLNLTCNDRLTVARLFAPCAAWNAGSTGQSTGPDWGACCSGLRANLGPNEKACLCDLGAVCLPHLLVLDVPWTLNRCGLTDLELILATPAVPAGNVAPAQAPGSGLFKCADILTLEDAFQAAVASLAGGSSSTNVNGGPAGPAAAPSSVPAAGAGSEDVLRQAVQDAALEAAVFYFYQTPENIMVSVS